LVQEGEFITYLILRVRVRVVILTLLATRVVCHAAEAISCEAAQPA
jgi:hypothetical protein